MATQTQRIKTRAGGEAGEPRLLDGFDLPALLVTFACIAWLWRAPATIEFIAASAAASLVLERLLPYRQQRVLREGWVTDAQHAVLTWGLASVGAVAIVTGVAHGAQVVLPGPVGVLQAQPLWARIAEAVVMADFAAYWEHRAAHGWDFLWRFHSIHHMGEDLDWLSRYRIHPVDAVLLGITEWLPFYLLGTPPWAITAFVLFVYADGTFSHSNAKVSFGALWWLVKNPEYHRWHHAREKRAARSNYAELLPVWDIIFGTAFLEREREVQRYGIPGASPVAYVDQLAAPWARQPVD